MSNLEKFYLDFWTLNTMSRTYSKLEVRRLAAKQFVTL